MYIFTRLSISLVLLSSWTHNVAINTIFIHNDTCELITAEYTANGKKNTIQISPHPTKHEMLGHANTITCIQYYVGKCGPFGVTHIPNHLDRPYRDAFHDGYIHMPYKAPQGSKACDAILRIIDRHGDCEWMVSTRFPHN